MLMRWMCGATRSALRNSKLLISSNASLNCSSTLWICPLAVCGGSALLCVCGVVGEGESDVTVLLNCFATFF